MLPPISVFAIQCRNPPSPAPSPVVAGFARGWRTHGRKADSAGPFGRDELYSGHLERFADSNILLYAASGRPADRVKTLKARRLLREEEPVISFQVLQAFYANAVNSRKLALTPAQAAAHCRSWLDFKIVPLSADTFVRTLEIAVRYGISNWDAAIVAAALESGCHLLYSGDMSHGQDYGGVRVENPLVD